MRNWLKHEEKICSLKRSKKACRYGKTKFPVMEKEVYTKFLDMRKEAKRVKCWWFNTKARELVEEKYPDEASSFNLSYRWCEGFCRRHSIIFLLRNTHAVQKSSAALRTAIEKFHVFTRAQKKNFPTYGFGNMDQTPFLFVMDGYRTYKETGAEKFWIASGKSGLEKR